MDNFCHTVKKGKVCGKPVKEGYLTCAKHIPAPTFFPTFKFNPYAKPTSTYKPTLTISKIRLFNKAFPIEWKVESSSKVNRQYII